MPVRHKAKNKFFNMKLSADGKSGDIFIYGEITKWAWEEYGEVSSITFKEELDKLGDVEQINLYINSPGGSVFETMAIIAMLERHPAEIHSYVDGVAASCASVLPMISSKIYMPENTFLMIHNAWTWAGGNANQLRQKADEIERINNSMIQFYLKRAGDKLSEEKLKELLDAETWLTADEALVYGLCDEVTNGIEAVASISCDFAKQYKNVPKQLISNMSTTTSTNISDEEMEERKKIAERAKNNAAYIADILGGIQ